MRKLRLEFDLIAKFMKAQHKARLSQKDLADRLGITKQSIIRLEGGGYASISIKKLERIEMSLAMILKFLCWLKKS